ncbi:SDR family NAD(P)-dependent oxidoreductase, partial [Dactylosporangium roseum]
ALEHPKLWGGLIDLPLHIDQHTAPRIAALLAPGQPEDQTAIRPTGTFARRMRHAPPAPTVPATWQPTGTTLITGGTGGIGAHLARWLASNGAPHLLLLSRRGPAAPGADALTQELEHLGTDVTITACDAADRGQLEQALSRIPADQPLTTVIHAAGVPNYIPVTNLTTTELDNVLRPKTQAAAHLHDLTKDHPVTTFLLFSSGAATWGSGQQSAYAAANHYLDALAHHRHHDHQPATSLAWGLWGEAGIAAAQSTVAYFSRFGLHAMNPDLATKALRQAVTAGTPTLTIADIDWAQFTPAFTAGRPAPLLADLPENSRPAADGAKPGATATTPLGQELRRATPSRRYQILLNHVRTEAAATLGHSGADAIPANKPLRELGFDSLTAVQLRNQLNRATGLELPATIIFDQPTPQALARYIEGELLGERPAATRAAVVHPAGPGRADDEPIAIVGMACRYPGGVRSADDLWKLVVEGRDAIGGFPTDRGWDLDSLFDPDPDKTGKSYVREGGFVYDAADFDAAFFGISPREAIAMDPQQRLLLETAWATIEDAGINRDALKGSETGVFAGLTIFDYLTLIGMRTDEVEGYIGTGNLGCVASGRISYILGLQGPAVTVDTGCSSSLVAMHLASQALRQGECTLALAGGATVMATPASFVEFSRQRGIAPDARCKPFADAADGTSWAEGAALIMLERLSDARRNGHNVLAVIRGSAVNQDGTSNGLTAPNGPSQERVIRQALANARLSAADVDAVEAHGTGTPLGDPIEAQALLATYGQDRPDDAPLWLGSVKSNIGHTQAAAGAAGVIKMVMAIRNGLLPASLHIDRPSTRVNWNTGAVNLLAEARDWPDTDHPRRAGVSAFGISGTNAHLIVEQAPEEPEQPPSPTTDRPVPWVICGHNEEALHAQARQLAEHVTAHPDLSATDIGWSLINTRSPLGHRAVVTGTSQEKLLGSLRALAEGEPDAGVVTGVADTSGSGAVLVFPGQGSQWVGMGAQLLTDSPVFATRITECELALAPHVDWSLTEILRGDGTELRRVDVVQPVLWAIMVSLAAVWRHHGVTPAAVIGHSQGEIAAACVAGALTLDDAAKVVALRSKALRRLSGQGAMASIATTAEQTTALLADIEGIGIAATNSPTTTVISGPPEHIATAVTTAHNEGLRARAIDVDYASHGPQIDRLTDEIADALAGITASPTDIAFYSTVTTEPTDGADLGPDYWIRNLRQPVRFAETVTALLNDGHHTFIEVSPHPVLTPAVEECADHAGATATTIGTLRREHDESQQLIRALAQAFAAGSGVDWTNQFPADPPPRIVDLPGYAFQRRRFWLDAPIVLRSDPAGLGLTTGGHPLLGATVEPAGEQTLLLTGRVSQQSPAWLAEHRVLGSVLLPGSVFAELALYAARRAGCDHVAELTLESPLALPSDAAVDLQVSVGPPDETGQRPVGIHSRPSARYDDKPAWTRHATGSLAPEAPAEPAAGFDGAWPPQGAEPITAGDPYEELAAQGHEYGPASRALVAAWRAGDDIYAEVTLPESERKRAGYGLHPVLVDATLHAVLLAAGTTSEILLPFAWTGLRLHATAATSLRVRMTREAPDRLALTAVDPAGAPVMTLESLIVRPVAAEQIAQARGDDALLRLDWLPFTGPARGSGERYALLVPDGDALARAWPDASAYRDLAGLRAAVAAGADRPGTVVALAHTAPDGDALPDRLRCASGELLSLLQDWVGDSRFDDTRLVVVTHGAVAVHPGDDVGDLAAAALWGMVRCAQIEFPRRLVLLDLDGQEASHLAVAATLASGEPQLALRGGSAFVPRLVRPDRNERPVPPAPLDPRGTVLITGGTGGLGTLCARHLITRHGVRRLLLISRRGLDAPGAADVTAELTSYGADVTVAACDVGDRARLAEVLAAVPEEHPLTAVIHAAGIVRDATLQSMTPDQFDAVLRTKADGAIHLHELIGERNLSAFVLFSSVVGLIGGGGQGCYAAANAFLDAFAQHRHALGRPATSLAWGMWQQSAGMWGRVGESNRARHARDGLVGMSIEQGLSLFDTAMAGGRPLLAPVRLDLAQIRRNAETHEVPAVLRHLIRDVALRSGGPTPADLIGRLTVMSEADREQTLLDLVRGQAAVVLGHDRADTFTAEQRFQDLGFDSLTAIELRNRLQAATGLRLPATLVFDHRDPVYLARHLLGELKLTQPDPLAPVLGEVDRLERSLLAVAAGNGTAQQTLTKRLRDTLLRLEAHGNVAVAEAVSADRLATASADEIFEFIDRDLGRSTNGGEICRTED